MAKKFTGVRLPEETRSILEVYAEKDGRSLSNLILKILEDWIREQGIDKAEVRKKRVNG